MLDKYFDDINQCIKEEQLRGMLKAGTATIDYDTDTEMYDIIDDVTTEKRQVTATVIEVSSAKRIWHNCPDCGQKLFRVTDESKAEKIYPWCKKCKTEKEINL